MLMRDERIRQPIPAARGPDLDSAAAIFARGIVSARQQLAPARRCENAIRDNDGVRAVETGRNGVVIYPRAVIARTCLVRALRFAQQPAVEILRVANEILDIAPNNPHAIESGAIALDALKRRDDAGDYWLRLAATDTANLKLAFDVASALLYDGNSIRAAPFIENLTRNHPDDIRFTRLKAQASRTNKEWTRFAEAAEVLIARDSLSMNDPVFHQALGVAYAEQQKPIHTINVLSRAVIAFPDDARLYALYTQYVRAESDTAIRRGLAKFPKSAELLALSAKDLRARGKLQESLEATRMAVALDSAMKQGHLMVAQLEMQMARPDSALEALRRGLVAGEDTAIVAQFSLGEGNALYRAASTAKTENSYRQALMVLTFADSLKSTTQSQFLRGAAALGVANALVSDAANEQDKLRACQKTEEGLQMIAISRSGLLAGDGVFNEQARSSLEFLGRLDEFAQQRVKAVCQ
ncbi:MAG: tetratricopeptide repeat protein [Gemmatimonas sp.]